MYKKANSGIVTVASDEQKCRLNFSSRSLDRLHEMKNNSKFDLRNSIL